MQSPYYVLLFMYRRVGGETGLLKHRDGEAEIFNFFVRYLVVGSYKQELKTWLFTHCG